MESNGAELCGDQINVPPVSCTRPRGHDGAHGVIMAEIPAGPGLRAEIDGLDAERRELRAAAARLRTWTRRVQVIAVAMLAAAAVYLAVLVNNWPN